MLSKEQINQKVYQNSLNTCEYIDGYQTRISTIQVKCLKHNLIFETKYENVARDNRAHHICPQCQQEDIENKKKTNYIDLECAYCHKKFQDTKSRLNKSKSGLYFCCREHKDLAQRLESGDIFQSIRPEHYGKNIIKDYRKTAFNLYPHKCAFCGWNEDEDILEVHHIDENHNNNEDKNLMIVCPTCHRKLTLHKYKIINNKLEHV